MCQAETGTNIDLIKKIIKQANDKATLVKIELSDLRTAMGFIFNVTETGATLESFAGSFDFQFDEVNNIYQLTSKLLFDVENN